MAAAQAMFDSRPEREAAESLRLEQEAAEEAERRAHEASLLEGSGDAGLEPGAEAALAGESPGEDEPDEGVAAGTGTEPVWGDDTAPAESLPAAERQKDE